MPRNPAGRGFARIARDGAEASVAIGHRRVVVKSRAKVETFIKNGEKFQKTRKILKFRLT